ncbi:hypothetical protein [Paracoccus aerius]|uniref:Uncharacterized protein n=1 Tax=Paracoccus aerius TaxID=1915382 RepID=A0ABS1S828_9RHOB|nr:hypothetical protein [Paracoccus aerius]MBL3674883.1 hypothetical protein [Paracoccus aerius]GHG29075.1 hypothetical protein GCM10017322_29570 [Paracoccus aerius]
MNPRERIHQDISDLVGVVAEITVDAGLHITPLTSCHALDFGGAELFNALRDICGMFTPAECWNYFQAAGYVAG